ncbi:hypothetical protein MMC07_000687 [Pseudocyphellaria aurata]|nr:hypothetical protein [Pseudocyphellaria aurata]
MSDPASSQPSSLPPGSSPLPLDSSQSIFGPRSRKQLSIFFGGAAFFGIATLITRRALVRRYKASIPRYFQQSNRPSREFNGGMEAFEALNIATINVASIAMMLTGGLLWAFDISSIDEARFRIRSRLGIDGSERGVAEAEEEFEEWLATTLARKENKQKKIGGEVAGEDVRTNEEGKPR